MPRISIVLCTYNRADILPRCLLAATNQSLLPSEYDVVVVDNASTDHTRAIVERISVASAATVRYLYHPVKGLSNARNAGARAALAPVITYIDDDAIAHPLLLDEIVRTFDAHPDAGAVGGRIDLSLPNSLPKWYCCFFDGYYSKFDLGLPLTTKVTEVWQYPYGANISFRRAVLDEIGYFNTAMGRIGRDSSGGEELDACCRLARLGYGIWYNPAAVVQHIILPSRLHWSHISNTARAAGRNWAYYELELLKHKWTIRPEVAEYLATLKPMILAAARRSAQQFRMSYSQHIFYRSKILRKLRYLMQGAPSRGPMNSSLVPSVGSAANT